MDEHALALAAINRAYQTQGPLCVSFQAFGPLDKLDAAKVREALDAFSRVHLITVMPKKIAKASVLGGMIPADGYEVALTQLGGETYSEQHQGFCLGTPKATELMALKLEPVEGRRNRRLGEATYRYTLELPSWARALQQIPTVASFERQPVQVGHARIMADQKTFIAQLLEAP